MAAPVLDEKKLIEREEAFPMNPVNPTLSQAINTSTKDLHDEINMKIVARLASCLKHGSHHLYREGIVSYYHTYATFERTWAALLSSPSSMPTHVYEALCAISDPRMTRTLAIAADLSYLYDGAFDPATPTNRPQVAAYVEHIENTFRARPHVVIAYAHVYYMGLFAGGRVLRKMLEQRKGFFPVHSPASDEEMARKCVTNMFAFPGMEGKEEEIRAKFKAAMCVAEDILSEQEKTEIIEEARKVFTWNGVLVKELDEICAPLAAQLATKKAGSVVFEAAKTRSGKMTVAVVGLLLMWFLYCLHQLIFT